MKIQIRDYLIETDRTEIRFATPDGRIIAMTMPFGPVPITREALVAKITGDMRKLNEARRLAQVVVDLRDSREWVEIDDEGLNG